MDAAVSKFPLTNENLQFKPWLVQQISSGKYKDLEWIDADQKRVFKLPWTKKNYPNWEEHHEIFRAWAKHRSVIRGDPKVVNQHISLMKSNFRTILRKCSEIEELKNFHQLGLQTGNYKVYKVLTEEEALRKRSRLKTDEIVEGEEPSSDIIEISSNVNIQDIQWLPEANIPPDWIAASSSIGMALLEVDQPSRKRSPSPEPEIEALPKSKIKKTQSTQTATKDPHFDAKEVIFLSEPEIADNGCSLERASETDYSPPLLVEVEDKVVEIKSENTEGFSILLEAAGIAEPTVGALVRNDGNTFPSVVEVLDKLGIPREELHTYEMVMKYEQRDIWNGVYCEMDRGYRIHNDVRDGKNNSNESPYVSLKLPAHFDEQGRSFETVLRNMDGGLILQSDASFHLVARRSCQSRVFAITSFSDFDSDLIQLGRDEDITLFSYSRFLQEWYFALKTRSSISPIDIQLSFGKKPKKRDGKMFVSLKLVPKAAVSLLDFATSFTNYESETEVLKRAKVKHKMSKVGREELLGELVQMFE